MEENLALAAELLEKCAALDIVLELEIGIVGGVEDASDHSDVDRSKLYTSPEDMVRVTEVLGTFDRGRYLLAAVFGNVHGVYKPGAVQLDPTILRDGQQAVAERFGEEARHYLVFHGGSGSSLEEIHETLGYGVVKMNVDTDCQYAYTRPIAAHMFANFDGVLKVDGDVGDKKAYDPRTYMKLGESGMSARVVEACQVLRSAENSHRLTMDPRHRTWATSERFVPKTFIEPVASVHPDRGRLGNRPAHCRGGRLGLGEQRLVGDLLLAARRAPDHRVLLVPPRRVGPPSDQRRSDGHLLLRGGPRDQTRARARRPARPEDGRIAGDGRPRRHGRARTHLRGLQRRDCRQSRLGDPDGHGHRVRRGCGRSARLAGPPGAKLFLLAVAIADDIGAIAVIAIFYTSDLDGRYLAAAIVGLLVVWVASRVGIRAMWFYIPIALVIWYFTLESGVHATLAGVALGFLTPANPYYRPREFDERARAILDQYEPDDITDRAAQEHADHEALLLSDIANESVAPLARLEHRLVGWSSFVIVPIFALANAGVDFRGSSIADALTSRVALGVSVGLIVGKFVGISLASLGAVRFGLGRLPAGTSWSHVLGLAAVAGVGFTVSLFVAGLAFSDPELAELAKVGIFAGSLVSGIIGSILLTRARPPSET